MAQIARSHSVRWLGWVLFVLLLGAVFGLPGEGALAGALAAGGVMLVGGPAVSRFGSRNLRSSGSTSEESDPAIRGCKPWLSHPDPHSDLPRARPHPGAAPTVTTSLYVLLYCHGVKSLERWP